MSWYVKSLLIIGLFCVRMEAIPTAQNFTVKEILSQIPREDYEILDQLFRTLIFENYFAYTLFGSKPMTHKGAFYNVLTKECSKDSEGDYFFLTHWEVWKKYSSRPEFQMPNYVFVEKKFPELFEIHFLNKKNILICVQAHLSTFREILGKDTTPEKVYQDMITADDIYEALGNSQILYGILFGFGEKNARGYSEKFELELDIPEPTAFTDEEQKPNRLSLPYFSVFGSSRETDSLRRTYQQERRRILSLYSKGNFLEITLNKLLSKE